MSELVFKGSLISVRVSDGHEVVEHPGSVAILAVDDQRRVILAPQRRPAVGHTLLEVPAGTRDQVGEDPADTARRELEEETGLVAGQVEHLGSFYPSPGYTNERQDLFLVTGVSGDAHDAERVPIEEAAARAARGEVPDLKTAFALLLAARRLG